MNETYPSTNNLTGPGLPKRGLPLAALGQFASAAFILGLAGAALWLMSTTLAAGGTVEGPAERVERTGNGAVAARQLTAPHLTPHLFIVVATEERAGEIRDDLARDADLRGALAEQRRDAEVIAAANEAEAVALAETIDDQSNMPGATRMVAMVVR